MRPIGEHLCEEVGVRRRGSRRGSSRAAVEARPRVRGSLVVASRPVSGAERVPARLPVGRRRERVRIRFVVDEPSRDPFGDVVEKLVDRVFVEVLRTRRSDGACESSRRACFVATRPSSIARRGSEPGTYSSACSLMPL